MTGWSGPGDVGVRELGGGGMSLRALLLEEGATGPEAALVVLKDSLHGLATAAEPHGDYKPENVVVTPGGGSVLTNFGTPSPAARTRLSSSTPFYLAPEQWGRGGADPLADIYAATVTFFECVVGAPPYYAADPTVLRWHHATTEAPVEAAPAAVRGLVLRGVAKDPDQRPATADDFLAELEVAAVAGYGPGWEQRGRRELASLMTPTVPFHPVSATATAGAAPTRKARGRTQLGRAAAAAAAAMLLAVPLAGSVLYGRVPTGADGSLASADRGGVPGSTASPPPAAETLLVAPGGFPAPREPVGVPAFSVALAAGPETSSRSLAGAPDVLGTVTELPPARSGTRPPAPQTQVTTLSIASFDRLGPETRVVVTVNTSDTGPVLLSLRYAGGPQGGPGSRNVQTVNRTLSGSTSYPITDVHDFSTTCTDYWQVLVETTPAAGNGAQSAEVPAIPCATPTATTTTEPAPPPG